MTDCISYEQTKRFKSLFIDYIDQDPKTYPFYNLFPSMDNFKAQIENKRLNYEPGHRELVVKQLQNQYSNFKLSLSTKKNINYLLDENTFTITTGHQLNLFTGPLYTFYKIISVINSCKILNKEYSAYKFVPVFWLASEDHDFEEINFFNIHSSKFSWDKEVSGAVGEISTEGLESVFKNFKSILPKGKSADELMSLFKSTYLEHNSLSEASIFLYNYLFGEEGLIVLEPNHNNLKSTFKSFIKKEVLEKVTFESVNKTSQDLKDLNYHEQVTPREINFFYKTDNLRERIIFKDDRYYINKTDISFSKDEILFEIESNPDRFSPNSLLRPLYQEVLLPNLSYVGGAGELAYWLQLKSTFNEFDVIFPMLQMRNSVLVHSEKTRNKLEKIGRSPKELFQSEIDLKNLHTKEISEINIDFSVQKKHLEEQFKALYKLAEQTDKSFLNAVAAQETKQKNGLDKLEKRLLKAERLKLKDELNRLILLQEKLFPNGNLQERYVNFSDLYLTYGDSFKSFLLENLDPFNYKFLLIELSTSPKSIPDKFTTDCI